MGEDIEYSIRMIRNGFRTGLIPEAFVYHKRRTSFGQFFRQLHFFGRARINISRFYPEELKPVHLFPALFFLGCLSVPLLALISRPLFLVAALLLAVYVLLIFMHATVKNRDFTVGLLSVGAVFVQLFGYGIGFLTEGWCKLRRD
jgi:GT2 family glycosyltransferase